MAPDNEPAHGCSTWDGLLSLKHFAGGFGDEITDYEKLSQRLSKEGAWAKAEILRDILTKPSRISLYCIQWCSAEQIFSMLFFLKVEVDTGEMQFYVYFRNSVSVGISA